MSHPGEKPSSSPQYRRSGRGIQRVTRASTKLFGTGEQPPDVRLRPRPCHWPPEQRPHPRRDRQAPSVGQPAAADRRDAHRRGHTTTSQSRRELPSRQPRQSGTAQRYRRRRRAGAQGSTRTPKPRPGRHAAADRRPHPKPSKTATNANGMPPTRCVPQRHALDGNAVDGMPGGSLPLGLGGLGGLGAPASRHWTLPTGPLGDRSLPPEAPRQGPLVTSMAPTEPHVASAPGPTPVIPTPPRCLPPPLRGTSPAVAPANPCQAAASPAAGEANRSRCCPQVKVVTAPNAAAAAACAHRAQSTRRKGTCATTA